MFVENKILKYKKRHKKQEEKNNQIKRLKKQTGFTTLPDSPDV